MFRALGNLFKRATLDTTALRESAPFRRLFTAQLISSIGSQVTTIAVMYQVYKLTDSSLMVGLVGLAQFVPTLVFALLGGSLADSMDRRVLLVRVQVAMACSSGSLMALAIIGSPPVGLIIALAAITSALAAIDGPARSAIIPMLVTPIQLRSAVQLREVLTQSGRLFGPMVGGVLIASVGLPAAYAADMLSFIIAFVLFLGLPSLVPERGVTEGRPSIREGVRFVAKRPVLASTFVADMIAMVLGMPRAVFPALAIGVYGMGPVGVGMLNSAIAGGAIVGLLFAGLANRVDREGLAVVISVAIWGAAIAATGLVHSFPLTLLFLAIAGWADMISALFRQTILLALVPDDLRGRMAAMHILVVTGGPPLGDMRTGATAEYGGEKFSMVVGGLGCIVGAGLLALKVPAFVRWRRSEWLATTTDAQG